jgi:hypothetical protein
MKRSKFSDSQIVGAVKRVETGLSVLPASSGSPNSLTLCAITSGWLSVPGGSHSL